MRRGRSFAFAHVCDQRTNKDVFSGPSAYVPKIVAVYFNIPEMSVCVSQREFSYKHFCSSDKLLTNSCPLRERERTRDWIYQHHKQHIQEENDRLLLSHRQHQTALTAHDVIRAKQVIQSIIHLDLLSDMNVKLKSGLWRTYCIY